MATGLRERKLLRTREQIASTAMKLFEERGFDATSVEQIAEAAEVAPRTFYRYFPTKEDVLFSDTAAEATLTRVLGERRPGERDVELAARAMCAAMLNDQERVAGVRKLIESTPALRSRALSMMWRTSEIVATHLAGTRPASREMRLRTRVIAASATAVARTAVFEWMDGGSKGSAWKRCEKALAILRDDLAGT